MPLYSTINITSVPSQLRMSGLVEEARNRSDLAVRGDHLTWLEEFKVFEPYFPVEPEKFVEKHLDWLEEKRTAEEHGDDIGYEYPLAAPYDNVRVTFTRLRLRINVLKSSGEQELTSWLERWEAFIEEMNRDVASDMKVLMVSESFTITILQTKLVDSMLTAIVVSLALNGFCVLIFTCNLWITLITLTAVMLCMGTLFGVVSSYLAWEFGPIQVIGTVSFVGMSIDYVLHLSHGYQQAKPSEPNKWKLRKEKAKQAVRSVGGAIFCGGLTTGGAMICLCSAKFVVFFQLGVILCLNAIISVAFTFLFMVPLLSTIGPTRTHFCSKTERRRVDH